MPFIGRDEILASVDIKPERVEVPEWGSEAFVFVRPLSGLERGHYEQMMGSLAKPDRYKKSRGLLCALGICDEAGEPVFSPDDVDRLSKKNAAPLDRCFDKIYARSGMSVAEAEKVEKNSEATPGEDG